MTHTAKHPITSEQAKTLYRELRQVDLKDWKNADGRTLAKSKLLTAQLSGVSNAQHFGIALTMLGRAAHSCEEKLFVDSLTRGDFPPIKMSVQEMEVAKGGFLLLALPAIASIGALVTAIVSPSKGAKK